MNLHDDENTSVEAARRFIAKHGGSILEVVHTGQRNVVFVVDADTFRFDPNRIFTSVGIQRTLQQLSKSTPAATSMVAGLAEAITSKLGVASPSWVIALHNNTENSYSLNSYLRGGPYFGDASAIHRNYTMDADDFFFVTEEPLYYALARQNFNVVFQNNDGATDDGSLSIYSARRGFRYVNVEAQHGHRRAQQRMISKLVSILESDETH